jgi:hypothetical protein
MRTLTLLSAGVLLLCRTLLAVENPTTFPILGGSFRQTMRIAITANSRAGCTAVAGFRNSLAAQPGPDRTLTLAAGHTGFIDLNLSRLVTAL